jgi:hypothetical protein
MTCDGTVMPTLLCHDAIVGEQEAMCCALP